MAAGLASENSFWPTSRCISCHGRAAKPARTIPGARDTLYTNLS